MSSECRCCSGSFKGAESSSVPVDYIRNIFQRTVIVVPLLPSPLNWLKPRKKFLALNFAPPRDANLSDILALSAILSYGLLRRFVVALAIAVRRLAASSLSSARGESKYSCTVSHPCLSTILIILFLFRKISLSSVNNLEAAVKSLIFIKLSNFANLSARSEFRVQINVGYGFLRV